MRTVLRPRQTISRETQSVKRMCGTSILFPLPQTQTRNEIKQPQTTYYLLKALKCWSSVYWMYCVWHVTSRMQVCEHLRGRTPLGNLSWEPISCHQVPLLSSQPPTKPQHFNHAEYPCLLERKKRDRYKYSLVPLIALWGPSTALLMDYKRILAYCSLSTMDKLFLACMAEQYQDTDWWAI